MKPPGPALRRVIGGVIALALIVGVLIAARSADVWGLMKSADPLALIPAAAAAAVALLLRGIRLLLVAPAANMGISRAVLVAAAAQGAALFVPARVGELALPLLLKRESGVELSAGIGTLFAVRTFDLAATGLWGGVAVLAVWGVDSPLAFAAAVALMVPPLILPVVLRLADRTALHCLAVRGGWGRRWTRQVRTVRRTVADLGRRPARLIGAFAASFLMTGSTWVVVWFLLAASGFSWPAQHVVAGSAAASLANLLPFNLVANLGTLEAGWTAAFTALGVPLDVAAATGLICHLWSLLFAAAYALIAWVLLELGREKDHRLKTKN